MENLVGKQLLHLVNNHQDKQSAVGKRQKEVDRINLGGSYDFFKKEHSYTTIKTKQIPVRGTSAETMLKKSITVRAFNFDSPLEIETTTKSSKSIKSNSIQKPKIIITTTTMSPTRKIKTDHSDEEKQLPISGYLVKFDQNETKPALQRNNQQQLSFSPSNRRRLQTNNNANQEAYKNSAGERWTRLITRSDGQVSLFEIFALISNILVISVILFVLIFNCFRTRKKKKALDLVVPLNILQTNNTTTHMVPIDETITESVANKLQQIRVLPTPSDVDNNSSYTMETNGKGSSLGPKDDDIKMNFDERINERSFVATSENLIVSNKISREISEEGIYVSSSESQQPIGNKAMAIVQPSMENISDLTDIDCERLNKWQQTNISGTKILNRDEKNDKLFNKTLLVRSGSINEIANVQSSKRDLDGPNSNNNNNNNVQKQQARISKTRSSDCILVSSSLTEKNLDQQKADDSSTQKPNESDDKNQVAKSSFLEQNKKSLDNKINENSVYIEMPSNEDRRNSISSIRNESDLKVFNVTKDDDKIASWISIDEKIPTVRQQIISNEISTLTNNKQIITNNNDSKEKKTHQQHVSFEPEKSDRKQSSNLSDITTDNQQSNNEEKIIDFEDNVESSDDIVSDNNKQVEEEQKWSISLNNNTSSSIRKYFVYIVNDGHFTSKKQCIARIELPYGKRVTLADLRQIIVNSRDVSLNSLKRSKFKFVTETYRLLNENEDATILNHVYPTQGVFLKLNLQEQQIGNNATNRIRTSLISTADNKQQFSTVRDNHSKKSQMYEGIHKQQIITNDHNDDDYGDRCENFLPPAIKINHDNVEAISKHYRPAKPLGMYRRSRSTMMINSRLPNISNTGDFNYPTSPSKTFSGNSIADVGQNKLKVFAPLPKFCSRTSCARFAIIKCGLCSEAFYCSNACRNIDWSQQHKTFCQKPKWKHSKSKLN